MWITKALLLALAAGAVAGPALAAAPAGFTLAWSEDFKQPVHTPPDPARWVYDLGAGGWGNGELETYVDDVRNAHVVADPFAADGRALQITAERDGRGGYRSARILTRDKVTFQYGYVEARIQIPRGQGIWPAFWMLGQDIGTVGWPACGEIDVMENIGREPSRNHGSLHGPSGPGGNGLSSTFDLPGGEGLWKRYHLFAIDWREDAVSFYVDGKRYVRYTPRDLRNGGVWAFNKPFFLLLNVAVGGTWPGAPDETTVVPQSMKVDYVRVYRAAKGA
jgi:beta-glucanase (GH16 family)